MAKQAGVAPMAEDWMVFRGLIFIKVFIKCWVMCQTCYKEIEPNDWTRQILSFPSGVFI